MLKHWKKLSTEIIKQNPWWTYKKDIFQIPEKEQQGEYHYVHTEGASLIIPVTNDGKIILVKQYRYLCDRESIEFPCGGVKINSTYQKTAQQELEEETGYSAKFFQEIGEFNPYNGVTNEICKIFLAKNLQKVISKPDVTEEFEILYCTFSEIEVMIQQQKIWDGMTLAAWALTKHLL